MNMNEVTVKAIKILKLQQIALTALLNVELVKKLRKKLRRWWVKPHLLPEIRNAVGASAIVCQYFELNDHEEFELQFKMTVHNFESLYDLVGNRLQKQNHVRLSIPSDIRLALTLQYLGHGGSARLNSLYYRVGKSTYYNIILDTCKVVTTVLIPMYIKFPNHEGWLKIAQDFQEKWNFPNCIGALDGKHMRIKRPPQGGSVFFNYKRFHSMVRMAISDAHCRFVWFTLGDGGSFSDSSVFNNSKFCRKLLNNELNIPAPTQLPNSNRTSPFVLVADEIFALGNNLMKPYNRKLLRSEQERIFNYILSLARFTIECAFGILCSKWQILNSALGYKLMTNRYIISACLSLHNFLITNNKENLHSMNDNVREEEMQNNNVDVGNPIFIRHNLTQYFCNEGSVPWQQNYI